MVSVHGQNTKSNAMSSLWNTITDKKYVVKLTYIQVYNEVIQDLLTTESKPLDIREDPVHGTSISGVSEIITNSPQEIMTVLK